MELIKNTNFLELSNNINESSDKVKEILSTRERQTQLAVMFLLKNMDSIKLCLATYILKDRYELISSYLIKHFGDIDQNEIDNVLRKNGIFTNALLVDLQMIASLSVVVIPNLIALLAGGDAGIFILLNFLVCAPLGFIMSKLSEKVVNSNWVNYKINQKLIGKPIKIDLEYEHE